MAEQRQADKRTDTQESAGKALKRRGLMAAAAALVVGIAAKQTSQPVAASTSDSNFVATGGGDRNFGFGTEGGG